MKEILGKKIENFTQSEVDPETIPFKDKNQESQYLQKRDNTVAKKGNFISLHELLKLYLTLFYYLLETTKTQQQTVQVSKKKDIKNDKTKRKRAVQKV